MRWSKSLVANATALFQETMECKDEIRLGTGNGITEDVVPDEWERAL